MSCPETLCSFSIFCSYSLACCLALAQSVISPAEILGSVLFAAVGLKAISPPLFWLCCDICANTEESIWSFQFMTWSTPDKRLSDKAWWGSKDLSMSVWQEIQPTSLGGSDFKEAKTGDFRFSFWRYGWHVHCRIIFLITIFRFRWTVSQVIRDASQVITSSRLVGRTFLISVMKMQRTW